MRKIILFIAMMLAIVGVYAQGVNFTVNKDLKKAYYMARINISSGTAPFDIVLNGRHLDQYHLYCQYDVQNIITITDANNSVKTDTIYEANPGFHWGIGYVNSGFTSVVSGISYKETGISIQCAFPDRYNFNINWYRILDYSEIGFEVDYEPVSDSIWTFLTYREGEAPVGIYAVKIRDTIHDMDTLVFIEITNPNATDTTTTDTTTTDTTITDTTSIDTTTTDTTILSLSSIDSLDNSIYPNPTKRFVNFTRPVEYAEILSTDGKVMMRCKNVNIVDISHLPSGTYYVRIGDTVKKILKI